MPIPLEPPPLGHVPRLERCWPGRLVCVGGLAAGSFAAALSGSLGPEALAVRLVLRRAAGLGEVRTTETGTVSAASAPQAAPMALSALLGAAGPSEATLTVAIGSAFAQLQPADLQIWVDGRTIYRDAVERRLAGDADLWLPESDLRCAAEIAAAFRSASTRDASA